MAAPPARSRSAFEVPLGLGSAALTDLLRAQAAADTCCPGTALMGVGCHSLQHGKAIWRKISHSTLLIAQGSAKYTNQNFSADLLVQSCGKTGAAVSIAEPQGTAASMHRQTAGG